MQNSERLTCIYGRDPTPAAVKYTQGRNALESQEIVESLPTILFLVVCAFRYKDN
jgi:hypothetical protein